MNRVHGMLNPLLRRLGFGESEPLVLVAPPTATYDTDCACPDRPFALNPMPSAAHCLYERDPATLVAALPAGHAALLAPLTPGGPCVLNAQALARWQAFCTPQPLTSNIDRQLADQQLLQPTAARPAPQLQPTTTLTAWLHVTNACNLDCPYCYVRKSTQHMDWATGQQALAAIFATARRHGFREVKLKYAGGEATLHVRLIRSLHAEAARLADRTGLQLREVILTNGVHLSPTDARWCRDQNIKLMVSLDGVGEAHDQLRSTRGGRSTFAAVQRTVDKVLLPLQIAPDITMTITGSNARDAAAVAQWAIVERNLPLNFNLFRQGLTVDGEIGSRRNLEGEETAIIEGLCAALAFLKQHVPSLGTVGGMLDRLQLQAHTHTCGAGQNYLVIGHTGQVSACQMQLDQGSPIGQSPTDLIPLVAAGAVHALPVDAKSGCAQCPIRYRCSGGCPIETFRATGRWDVQNPNCAIYRSIMPHMVELYGLALLRSHHRLN